MTVPLRVLGVDPMVSSEGFSFQLMTAIRRAATLRERAHVDPHLKPRLFDRALHDLEQSLEEVRRRQEQTQAQAQSIVALRADLAAEQGKYWRLLNLLPEPCLLTARDSAILEANRAASDLFNVSQRFLVGKALSVFVCEDRSRFLRYVECVARGGGALDLDLRVRPRERAPLDVTARVSADSDSTLRWLLQPVEGRNAGSN